MEITYTATEGTLITQEASKIVKGRDVNKFIGRILTFIDATADKDKAEAQKDIIKTIVWDWYTQVPPYE